MTVMADDPIRAAFQLRWKRGVPHSKIRWTSESFARRYAVHSREGVTTLRVFAMPSHDLVASHSCHSVEAAVDLAETIHRRMT